MTRPSHPTRLPTLGPRGEGWLALQIVALASAGVVGMLGPPWPARADAWIRVVGLALAAAGGALGIAGVRRLGDAVTPFPAPPPVATMREDGAYGLVRHPIYGGLLLVSLGWAAWTSPVALASTVLLAVVLEGKRRLEEAWFTERDGRYPSYARRVPRRFIPFLW